MLKKTAIVALALGLAAPAFASEQIARELKVDPDAYTRHEMVQIYTTGGFQRGQRIKLIHKQRAAFEAAVVDAVARSGVMSTSGVAPAR
ncbi:hypothetical protein [Rhodovulum marinum]|uniref:Uncharacterized protein n=1 Tax=Rhodovulum marinum TaxID=320662 RepID=A0A4R2Q5M7_9RHOB|nr:hypothetical protein [Rhodovulum marinum]TCP43254.1 hypothetical protein EV662_102451 [Rhodovulum marinum]